MSEQKRRKAKLTEIYMKGGEIMYEQNIINELLMGRSKKFVLAKYRLGDPALQQILKKHNIDYSNLKQNTYAGIDMKDVLEKYEQGWSLTELGEYLGHPAEAVLVRQYLSSRKKLRPLDKEELKADLEKNELSKTLLRQKYGLSATSFKELEFELGLASKSRRKQFYISKEELTQLYLVEKKTTTEIAEIYGCCDVTILNRMKEHGIESYNSGNVYSKFIDDNYFAEIDTAKKAYIVGYLFADGHIGRDGRLVSFDTNAEGKELLQSIKEEMNSPKPLLEYSKHRKNPMWRFCYYKEQHVKDLRKFGVITNKTYDQKGLKYEDIPAEFLPAYARGLLDGDGIFCFSETNRYVGFCSNYKETAADFQNLIYEILGIAQKGIYSGSTYFCTWKRIEDIKKIGTLYDIPLFPFNHKGKKLKEFLNNY